MYRERKTLTSNIKGQKEAIKKREIENLYIKASYTQEKIQLGRKKGTKKLDVQLSFEPIFSIE